MDADKKPDEETAKPDKIEQDSTEEVDESEESTAEAEDATEETPETTSKPADKPVEGIVTSKRKFKELLKPREFIIWARQHKKKSIPLGIVVLLLLLLAVPVTRYKLVGLVVSKDYQLAVVDSKTGKPVSSATVAVGSATAKTDAKGVAHLHVKVGKYSATVTKKYYKLTTTNVTVPIGSQKYIDKVSFEATGRQVVVTVHNSVGGSPEAGVIVKAVGTEAKTNSKGEATIVLPSDKASVSATLSKTDFNNQTATITVVEGANSKNTVSITPAGKLYFLSDATGKINVMKSNLDGSDRQVVLAGTGYESDGDTVLLASRDWKYLALKSIRDKTNLAQLYLISTSNDKLTPMDSGNADFTPVGWSDSTFVYTVQRNGVLAWQPHASAIKSYNASTGKLATIDQTDASGTGYYDYNQNTFNGIYLLNNELVYAKNWYGNNLTGKNDTLVSAKPDGSGLRTIQSFPKPSDGSYQYVDARLYEPQSLYVQVSAGSSSSYYEYEDGKLASKSITSSTYNKVYPTWLLSPDGQKTLWVQLQDGQNILYVGDNDGQNAKKIGTLSSGAAYGWYSGNYVLYSLSSSKLYIESSKGGSATKVTDYHKPQQDFSGYGGGYGGF